MNRFAVVGAFGCVIGFSALAGCAGTQGPLKQPVIFQPATKNLWTVEAGAFHVELVLGEEKQDADGLPPAPSAYRVSYHGASGQREIETKSRYTSAYFEDPYLGKLRPAQVMISDRGDALVIDEMIPNDCCATNNYTYIAVDSEEKLTCTYFELPEERAEPYDGMGDLPRVTGINGEVIRYRYARGKIGSVKVSNLKKIDGPVPPG
jgi:hypothetical protein